MGGVVVGIQVVESDANAIKKRTKVEVPDMISPPLKGYEGKRSKGTSL